MSTAANVSLEKWNRTAHMFDADVGWAYDSEEGQLARWRDCE